MYEAYFGLTMRPFAAVPKSDQYFAGEAIEYARGTLDRAMRRGEGSGLVIGPTGTGKTLLLQVLAEQLAPDHPVVMLSSGRLSTRRALLQAILHGLGRPYRDMDEGELRLDLVDHLTLSEECRTGLVLFVDEAHLLPLRLIEELRLLTNVSRQGELSIRLTLCGNSTLEERLANPKLEAFSQRIAARCYLESFKRTESESYVRALVEKASRREEPLFQDDACRAVWQATDGVPRLINQLCDHALLLAFSAGDQVIVAHTIENAWADLQQLPTPWNGDESAETGTESGSVVEFGGLDDEPAPVDVGPVVETREEEPLDEEPFEEEASPAVTLCFADELEAVKSAKSGPAAQATSEEDEGFRPAGKIRPELELVFTDMPHPIDEQFEEEEVIVAGSLGKHEEESSPPDEPTAKVDTIDSGSSEVKGPEPSDEPVGTIAFGSNLDDEPDPVAEPSEPVIEAEVRETAPAVYEEPVATVDQPAIEEFRPEPVAALPEEPAAETEESPLLSEVTELTEEMAQWTSPTLSMVSEQVIEEIEERPIIIVEESHESHEADKSVIPVRSHEYDQLFAQLRRDSQ